MSALLDVAIVGAGPYGLSIAAHLKSSGLNFRIFGKPMQTWNEHMPVGMLLKSDGFASNLSDPQDAYTLSKYCRGQKKAYDDRLVPVSLETFVEYGVHFQQQLLPNLDERDIIRIEQAPDKGYFVLTTSDGETFCARHVVLAIGIRDFAYIPEELAHLPPSMVSHSSAHKHLERFRGKSVSVLGSGASAVNLAAMLFEQGAKVCILSRRKQLEFHDPPSAKRRTLKQRLRNPSTGLGPGWKSWLFCNAPWAFRLLPSSRRLSILQHHLGPAGGWTMKDRLSPEIELLREMSQLRAESVGSCLRVDVKKSDGTTLTHMTSHLIAATGYRADVRKLEFLSDDLKAQITHTLHMPNLTSSFESSVRGLYFVGLASAGSFGPMMRFAFGSRFTAQRLSQHLKSRSRQAHS